MAKLHSCQDEGHERQSASHGNDPVHEALGHKEKEKLEVKLRVAMPRRAPQSFVVALQADNSCSTQCHFVFVQKAHRGRNKG